MIKSIWRAKIEAQQAALANAVELKAKRGKMPHWTTLPTRIKGLQNTVFGTNRQVHVMRPWHGKTTENRSFCGWHEVSFKHAHRFGFPTVKLLHVESNVGSTVHDLDQKVNCIDCYDVLNDIAVWHAMPKASYAKAGNQAHLLWHDDSVDAACGGYHDVSLTLEPAEFENTRAECCSICLAIYKRVWGKDRPEARFTSYTTNEEAAAILVQRKSSK